MGKQKIGMIVLAVLLVSTLPGVLAFDTFINNTNIFVDNFLGVGTQSPSQTLSVNGTFSVYNATGTLGLFQNESGRVGIGTTSPSSVLDIANVGGTDGVAILTMSENENDEFQFVGNFAGAGSTGNLLLLNTFWNNTAMTWRGDGRVGINTTSPTETLEVNGNVEASNLRAISLIDNRNPSGTTSSGTYATLASSSSTTFNGRPVIFFFDGSSYVTATSTKVEFAVQIDSGTDNEISQFHFNTASQHDVHSGMLMLTPTAGSHTINLRWRRPSGSGTVTVDNNDQLMLYAIEL